MEVQQKAQYEARAKIVKAIAHPTRLFIIDELHKGERCVYELTEMIGADTSTVSKHLLVLKNAGIVNDEKRGLQVFYSLEVPCLTEFFECIEHIMKSNAKKQLCLVNMGAED